MKKALISGISGQDGSPKEEQKRERARRYRLIRKARGGDAKATAKLQEKHRITKVWTQEEIDAYEGNA